ncbi:MAG: DNA replication and repair protein RecF [Spirochaetia bacterium]|nr:DNA replication and repair protein RecF [Spirochaetia bacterium]
MQEGIDTDAQQVLLIGENGQGKTNFLEAIYVLCYASSFRTNNLKELVSYGKKEVSLSALFIDDNGEKRKIHFKIAKGKKEIVLDGKVIHDRKQLMYTIPCIVFSHDDIDFIRGVPEARRKYFNQTMSMYDPVFFDDLRRYNRILRQRNVYLKSGKTDLLDIYDRMLCEIGLSLMKKRKETVEDMNGLFSSLYERVSSLSGISLLYQPSWKNCSTIEEAMEELKRNRERDLKFQITNTGIHRDNFSVISNNGALSSFGSTGQQRLASLVLRATQSKFFQEKTGRKPVLLIDDVLLELDNQKRSIFLSLLEGYSQAFFTFLPEESYFKEKQTEYQLMLDVRNGELMQHV